jgi:hypothetical protein
MKLLIMQLAATFCHFIPLQSKYLPQHPVFCFFFMARTHTYIETETSAPEQRGHLALLSFLKTLYWASKIFVIPLADCNNQSCIEIPFTCAQKMWFILLSTYVQTEVRFSGFEVLIEMVMKTPIFWPSDVMSVKIQPTFEEIFCLHLQR